MNRWMRVLLVATFSIFACLQAYELGKSSNSNFNMDSFNRERRMSDMWFKEAMKRKELEEQYKLSQEQVIDLNNKLIDLNKKLAEKK